MISTQALPLANHVRGLVERLLGETAESSDLDAVAGFYELMRDDPTIGPEAFGASHLTSVRCKSVVGLLYAGLERARVRDRDGKFVRTVRCLGWELDGYELKYCLGRGGMGEVYFADGRRQGRSPKTQAVKVVPFDPVSLPDRSPAQRADRRRRAVQEAEKLDEVRDHTHVVRFFGAKEDGTTESVFLRLEYLDAVSLSVLVERESLPSREAVALIRQSCDGLGAMHAVGVLHRDVKPANLMVNAEGQVKVTDLGLAGSDGSSGSHQLTLSGVGLGGTPGFAAPEQVFGWGTDARTDVYGLGWALFDLVCPPEAANWDKEKLFRLPPDPSASVWQSLPPGLPAVLSRATTRDPKDRFQTVAEFGAALDELGPDTELTETRRRFALVRVREDHEVNVWVGEDLAGRRTSEPVPIPPERKHRAAWIIPAAVCACLLAAVGLYFLQQSLFGKSAASQASSPSSSPDKEKQSPPIRYKGQVNVLIERAAADGMVRLLRLHEPGAAPLRKTDKFRIEGRVEPPAYLYMIWVDPGNEINPVYPWNAAKGWGTRPSREELVDRVSLPTDIVSRYEAPDAKPGVATIVLLARQTPLDASDDVVKGWFDKLPELPLPPGGEHAVVWFDDYQEVRDPDRPRTFGVVGSSDPFTRWQGQLQKAVGSAATFQTAVSFARTGGK